MAYLGFDTSNYTTSVALYYPESNQIIHKKRLLEVKHGQKGLRQSEAVFQHTSALPGLINELNKNSGSSDVSAVGVSVKPRLVEDSYMPCFLVGKASAVSSAFSCNVPCYFSSHQHGHVLAALYSSDKLELISERFFAFHLSGGTTDLLLVEPDDKEIFSCKLIGSSSDVKAGQIIDRSGVLLGMKFPCGAELDKLSLKSGKQYKIKPTVKNLSCSLSGIENKVHKMYDEGESAEDIAKFTIQYIIETVKVMCEKAVEHYGNLPFVFAGGVASNSLMQHELKQKFNAFFATPEFSSDNAAGMAIMAYLKHKNDNFKRNTD